MKSSSYRFLPPLVWGYKKQVIHMEDVNYFFAPSPLLTPFGGTNYRTPTGGKECASALY